jgi:hypothetical protein
VLCSWHQHQQEAKAFPKDRRFACTEELSCAGTGFELFDFHVLEQSTMLEEVSIRCIACASNTRVPAQHSTYHMGPAPSMQQLRARDERMHYRAHAGWTTKLMYHRLAGLPGLKRCCGPCTGRHQLLHRISHALACLA